MKRLLTPSLALNGLLLALLAYLGTRDTDVTPVGHLLPASPGAFHWSEIEAADYPTYIQNLRTIGCPEETIRDIITADVASLDARENMSRQSSSTIVAPSSDVAPSPPRNHRAVSPEQAAFVAELLARPSADLQVTGNSAELPRIVGSAAAEQPGSSPVRSAIANVARGDSREAEAQPPDLAKANQTATNAHETAAVDPASDDVGSAEEAPSSHKAEALFTVEEQRFRSLYGWATFYAAKQEQAIEAANEAQ